MNPSLRERIYNGGSSFISKETPQTVFLKQEFCIESQKLVPCKGDRKHLQNEPEE